MVFFTGSLKSESESIFNYNLTIGNFSDYNDHHTRPIFLEDLLGNFTELFKGHSTKDIDEFKTTCTNIWSSQLNNDCLLMIARTNDAIKGKEIMDESLRIHNKYEFDRKCINLEIESFLKNGEHTFATKAFIDPFLPTIKYSDNIADQFTYM